MEIELFNYEPTREELLAGMENPSDVSLFHLVPFKKDNRYAVFIFFKEEEVKK